MATKNFNIPCQTACLPTDAFCAPCRPNSSGGNSTLLYLIPICEVETITDAYDDNIITDITLDAGSAGWLTTNAVLDTLTVEENLNTTTGAFNYNISFQLSALAEAADEDAAAAAARNFIDSIANPYLGYMMIIEANHGVRYLYGEGNSRGLRIADGTQYVSGATIDELSAFTITMSGSGQIARPVSESVNLTTVTC